MPKFRAVLAVRLKLPLGSFEGPDRDTVNDAVAVMLDDGTLTLPSLFDRCGTEIAIDETGDLFIIESEE